MIALAINAPAFAGTITSTTPPVSFNPEQPRLGDVVMIELRETDPRVREARAHVFDYQIDLFRVDDRRLRGIAAIPLDIEPMSYLVKIKVGDRETRAWMQVIDREFDRSELTVSPRFTTKPNAMLRKRLQEEQRAWAALWKPPPAPPRFFGALQKPVTGIETAPFGTRRTFNGKLASRHYGLDLEGAIGDPIHAVQAGRVVMSAMRWASGGTVVVDHGSGLFTAYFHMSQRIAKRGDWVEAGQRLGLVGKTGRVTGPHLHLAVMVRMEKKNRRGETIARALYTDGSRFLTLSFEGDPAFLDPRPPKPKTAATVQQGKTP